MDLEYVREELRQLGFKKNETVPFIETWEKREGNLRFRAQMVDFGFAGPGLSLNGTYRDGRTLYDSGGLDRGAMSDLFSPPGFLGACPTREEITDRMDFIREDAGVENPTLREIASAISSKDSPKLRALIVGSSEVLVRKKRGMLRDSFLHGVQDISTAQILLGAGLDPNAQNRHLQTPLHRANNREIAQALIQAGADINAKTKWGDTPLHTSHTPGLTDVLLKAGADVGIANTMGETALDCKVKQDELVSVALLLSAGANPNQQGKDGTSSLHLVGDLKIAQLLLEFGANPNARDNLGRTPLFFVKSPLIAEKLIQSNADLMARDGVGASVLHLAANRTMARYFLENGLAVDLIDLKKRTPLHYAVKTNNDSLVRYFLSIGANVKSLEVDGNTPLHFAGTIRVCGPLLEAGADPNAKNLKGQTALHLIKNANLVSLLVTKGARINGIDCEGKTPLHFADNPRLVNALLKCGANVTIRDHTGKTACDYPRSLKVGSILRAVSRKKQYGVFVGDMRD